MPSQRGREPSHSRDVSSSPRILDSPPGSPRMSSVSLQAAATLNAGLQHEVSRTSSNGSSRHNHHPTPSTDRRRSLVMMNLHLNDPATPSPGEMADSQNSSSVWAAGTPPLSASPMLVARDRDPQHHRAPSLGELHQELEAEQEGQVNRLLQVIRQQQLQLQQLQSGQGAAVPHDESAVSDRSGPGLASQPGSAPPSAYPGNPLPPTSGSFSRSPAVPLHPRSSFDIARADFQRRSRTPSRGASPRLRATSIGAELADPMFLATRDESAFYQAETQMLMRENQMLRHRIRELEKQVAAETAPGSPILSHEPSQHSLLSHTHSVSEGTQHTPRGGPAGASEPQVISEAKEEN